MNDSRFNAILRTIVTCVIVLCVALVLAGCYPRKLAPDIKVGDRILANGPVLFNPRDLVVQEISPDRKYVRISKTLWIECSDYRIQKLTPAP